MQSAMLFVVRMWSRVLPVCAVISVVLLGMALMGCGSSASSVIQAGPISVITAGGTAGQITSLAQSATVKLSMTPVGDKLNAGVDWTVTCGGNPISGSITNGACGTFSPTHTSNGGATVFTAPAMVPIGTTVTITASVTSNPSQSTTINVTIVAVPVAISFGMVPPASLLTNQQVTLRADQTNAPASAGAVWSASCGAASCGSFNSPIGTSTIYTAPSVVPPGGTVTITVTSLVDTTKSVSATVTIQATVAPPPPPPIGVSVTPATLYAQTSRTSRFVGTLVNDTAQGRINWSVACGSTSCGQITGQTASGASATFIAPAAVPTGGTVTITATSVTDPTKFATAVATIITTTPIAVTFANPLLPGSVNAGLQNPLVATVASDPNNLGVDWTATCGSAGACGSFNLNPAHTASGGQIVYTAPSTAPTGGVVMITASSSSTTTDSNPASAVTTIVVVPTLSFAQPLPSTMTATAQAPVSVAIANDGSPGGVNWSVACGSTVAGGCGYISPAQTASGVTAIYTAPPVTSTGTSVTVTATSVAKPSISISSTPIAINLAAPNSAANFVPTPPTQVQANATVNLSAAVTNDTTNAGVDWQVCASGCGFFTTQPAIAAIGGTSTTPPVPPVAAVTSTHVTAWPNNLPLAYTAPMQAPDSGSVVLFIASHANPTATNSANITIGSNSNGPAIHGTVLSGTKPVAGAAVALYAAGTTGYASAASQTFAPGGPTTTLTGNDGSFTVSGGYACPPAGGQMYLVATGGSVGSNAPNPNLAMMTVLGSCNALSSSPVVVNEITSVASAYATAPFASNQPLTGLSSYAYLGSSSSNSTGLANAFAAVNNLVDISTGKVRFTVPAGNAAVPYVQINTLADILNSCTATSGGVYGDGSPCGALFSATFVLGANATQGSVAPADTLQALFNIVEHPITAYGYSLDPANTYNNLLALVPASAPYQPILTSKPNDWSLSLNYTGGGSLSTTSIIGSFAIDATGNLWITDTKNNTVAEWNTVGAALSPSTGFPAGGGPIVIDGSGDVWISGTGTLTELNSLGMPMPGSPFGGVPVGGTDMAIDAQNNLWIAAGGGVAEFDDLANALSPNSGYVNSGITGITSVGIDSSNNVWAAYAAGHAGYVELSNPGGALFNSSLALGLVSSTQLAADSAGNMWAVVPANAICKIPPYPGKGALNNSSTCIPGGGNSVTTLGFSFANPGGIALDGAGIIWFATSGGPLEGQTFLPSVLPYDPSADPMLTPPNLASPSLSVGTQRVAIDGSGNVWVLLANNTLTEYVGAAVPVVTPIAVGVQKKKLAAKP